MKCAAIHKLFYVCMKCIYVIVRQHEKEQLSLVRKLSKKQWAFMAKSYMGILKTPLKNATQMKIETVASKLKSGRHDDKVMKCM